MLAWIQASLQFDQTKMMDSYAQGLCTLSLQTDMLFPWLHCLKGREVPIPARTRMYPELQNTTSRFHKEGCWQHNFCGQVSKRKVSGQFWICSVASVFFFFMWTMMKNIMMCNCLTRSRNRNGSFPWCLSFEYMEEGFQLSQGNTTDHFNTKSCHSS